MSITLVSWVLRGGAGMNALRHIAGCDFNYTYIYIQQSYRPLVKVLPNTLVAGALLVL